MNNNSIGSSSDEAMRQRLVALCAEHHHLNSTIEVLSQTLPYDNLEIQRLKKRKLWLKDQIETLKNQLMPDIIA